MIPLELRLTNFLSYRQQVVVDLRPIHLASISGANGAGKSTLLDAIIWALFGKSRAISDDNLVHTAADGASAEVEFIFDMEGTVYRVLRRKRVRKSAELEFQIKSDDPAPNTPDWISLTEARIRETQAAIERTLRMNYDVFVNASFFLQGKADEFTSSKPTRRKEILAEVLGVTKWDNFGKQVATKRKQTEAELQLLHRRLEEVSAELAEAETRQQRLAEALTQEAAVRARLDDKELLLQQARLLKAEVDKQKGQVATQATELAELEREIGRLQKRIADREQERQQYESIVAESDQIEADYTNWSVADTAFQQWRQLADQRHQLQSEQNPLQLRIATERSRLEQRQQGLETQQAVQASRQDELETIEAELASSRTQIAELSKQGDDFTARESELRQLELEMERYAAEQRQLAQDLQRLTADHSRVESALVERKTLEASLQNARARIAELSADMTATVDLCETRATWLADREHLRGQRLQLKEEAEKEQARIDQLEEAGGDCPVCGQPLTAEHRATVVLQLNTELEHKRQKYRNARESEKLLDTQLNEQGDLQAKRAKLQRELDAQQVESNSADARLQSLNQLIDQWTTSGSATQLTALQAQKARQIPQAEKVARLETLRKDVARKLELEREMNSLQQQVTRYESRQEQIEKDAAVWETEGRLELEAVGEKLRTESFAQEEHIKLAEFQAKIDALGYDAGQHAEVQQRRSSLAAAPERYQSLGRAQAALKPLVEALVESTQQLTERTSRQAMLEAQHEAASQALATLQETAVDTTTVADEVTRLREEMSIASQYVGAAKQKVAVLDDRLQQQKAFLDEQNAHEQRINHLKILEEACGRKGVQALLIEHALPEIEERANELLDRLSGGAMRVTFETQRELKSRDELAETLDIHISDAAGERPYENFSGGEQFRVNFAVRLALSQALAHRAGAPLRTLVIDEGFGSQDPEGRQRLVESINAVQSDFACILVITHIEELRDAFPARIEVTKTRSGSQVEVIAGM